MEFRRATINDANELINLRKQQLLDEGNIAEQNIDKELKDYFLKNRENCMGKDSI